MELGFVADIDRDDLASAWDRLTAEGGCPGVFSARPWVAAWARAFGDGHAPEFALASESSEAVGVVPLFRRTDGVLTTPVNFLSHRGEVVARPGRERDVIEAVLERTRSAGDMLALRGVPVASPTREALGSAASGAGYILTTREGRSSPLIDTEGGWASYYASRPRKVTHEWERKIRKLERAGEVTVAVRDDEDTDALVKAFADVEDGSWKAQTGTSIHGRGVEAFYRDAARALRDAHMLRSWTLELDGRMIAFLFGVELGNTYYALKTSYLTEHSKLSPGVRLFRDAVRDAFERGLSCFDFVGQPARWKDEWATGRREHEDIMLYTDDLPGRARALLEGTVKPAARSARDRLKGRDGGA
jgi:CelD/BcsL family acetyltransferase involved in cellulose biosynthesis